MEQGEAEEKYGRRLMINIIDSVATKDPERHFIYVPNTGDLKDGWKPITYKQVARAIDHVAWKIANAPRQATQEPFPTLWRISGQMMSAT